MSFVITHLWLNSYRRSTMYSAPTGLWVQVFSLETKTITEFFVMPRMFHIITIELHEIIQIVKILRNPCDL